MNNVPLSDRGTKPAPLVKAGIVLLLVVAVGAVFFIRHRSELPSQDAGTALGIETPAPAAPGAEAAASSAGDAPDGSSRRLPRLIELGSDKCIPCRMMAPILDELRREYAGKLEVEFIDVWKMPEAGDKYRVRVIPTQVFLDASGKEVFRHHGFFPKDEILAKWKELGILLD